MLLVNRATSSNISKYVTVTVVGVIFPLIFSHFCDCDITPFEDHSLDLRKSKINQNLQFVFAIFISIYQLLWVYKLLILA